jgi:hypothetical protein
MSQPCTKCTRPFGVSFGTVNVPTVAYNVWGVPEYVYVSLFWNVSVMSEAVEGLTKEIYAHASG